MKNTISPRQVHLDFHTSPLIEGIGSRFSKENFQAALKEGNLSSITVFAKCHHGVCYYPTKAGTMHPHLNFDLLGEMIEAAHEIGVRIPVYITAGWSALDAENHPEWWMRNQDGTPMLTNFDLNAEPNDPKPNCSWIDLCLNDGSYAEHIYELTREVCDRYKELDGLFYDICFMTEACYCDECKAGMKKMGLDPEKEEDAKYYYTVKHQDFMRKCGEILHEKHPDATIFFNSGGADPNRPEYHEGSTHFELEDLPTSWGGYDKMPFRAKFFGKTGKGYLGMTGKFHTDWGEFGGFKLKEALKYEVASMMTYGAGCSIGDHLHPDGEMDMETYKNIGYAYRYAEQIEPYCLHGNSTAKLGIYLSKDEISNEGTAKMLLEDQIDFDIIYEDNFEEFDTVIFPDCVVLSEDSVKKLEAFIQNGGKVLITGESLVKDGKFQIDLGLEYQGAYGHDKDYIIVGDALAERMVTSPFLAYSPAAKVEVKKGEVLANVMLPYFRRTYETYCGHKNTPYNREDFDHAAAVKNGNMVYLAHKTGWIYKKFGSAYHRQYFLNALHQIYKAAAFQVEMPSAGRAAMKFQEEENRFCLNLLYASPVSRGAVEVIEDIVPLYNIPCCVYTEKKISRVYLGVGKEELPFTQKEGEVRFTVPYLHCHQTVVLDIE